MEIIEQARCVICDKSKPLAPLGENKDLVCFKCTRIICEKLYHKLGLVEIHMKSSLRILDESVKQNFTLLGELVGKGLISPSREKE